MLEADLANAATTFGAVFSGSLPPLSMKDFGPKNSSKEALRSSFVILTPDVFLVPPQFVWRHV